jgi:hypothetical protein
MHYVVIWETLCGRGSGHQLALDKRRAEIIHRAIRRALPHAECRIEPAESYAAAAVLERQRNLKPRRGNDRLRA